MHLLALEPPSPHWPWLASSSSNRHHFQSLSAASAQHRLLQHHHHHYHHYHLLQPVTKLSRASSYRTPTPGLQLLRTLSLSFLWRPHDTFALPIQPQRHVDARRSCRLAGRAVRRELQSLLALLQQTQVKETRLRLVAHRRLGQTHLGRRQDPLQERSQSARSTS